MTDALLLAWEATLARKSDAPAIFNTRGEVSQSFAQIEEKAHAFQAAMRDCRKGEIHSIEIGNHPDWPAIFLACLRLEVVAVPLDELTGDEQRRAALRACAPSAIGWGAHPPVLLKLTSGTTAAPRAIRFRSEQLLADCDQICETMGITEDDVNFGVIPFAHSYGFGNVVLPLLVRGIPMVVSRDRMPRGVLDDLARTGATIFPGMPVFFQAFSQMQSLPDLPKLRLCISAGAPLPLPVAQKFREQAGLSIHSFYGSSECGGICYDRDAELAEPGFVGQPMKGVDVRRLDPEGATSGIEVRSAAAGDGYHPVPDEGKLSAGRFVPDDLLTLDPDGFRIVGRLSDVINVAGKKVNPAEIEAVLREFSGVREAVVFGRGSALRNEEVAACITADPGVRDTDLLEFCRQRLSGWQVPKRIFFLDEMPVTERGKISRRELAARFDGK